MMLKITEFLCRLRFALTALTARKKEAGVFVLLALIAMGIILPNTAKAFTGLETIIILAIVATVVGMGVAVYEKFSKEIMKAILSGAAEVASFFYWICQQFNYMFTNLFDFVAKPLIDNPDWAITKNTVFLTNWTTMRNLANILIVLGIVIIALATILRLKEYEAKKLLIPLLIVALLINFSPLFVGIMIDISHLLMVSFMPNQQFGVKLQANIHESEKKQEENMQSTEKDDPKNFEHLIVTRIGYGLLHFFSGISFMYATLMMMQRYVVLAALFILSPLAFALFAFPVPKAKELFNQWWQNFVKWVFIGVGAFFFIGIGVRMAGSMETVATGNSKGLANLAVVLLFMVIGARMAKQGAGPVAEATIGIAKKGLMMAATGGAFLGKKIGGWAADRSGLKRGWENVKHKATQFAEKIPLVGAGRGAAARQKEADLKRSRAKTGSDERMAAVPATEALDVANSRAAAGDKGRNDKLAATERMVKEGKGHLLNEEESLDWYAGQTGKTAIYSQANPDHADKDTDRINEILSIKGKTMETATPEEIDNAKKTVRRESFQKMSDDVVPESEKEAIEMYNDAKTSKATKAKILKKAAKDGWSHKLGKQEKIADNLNELDDLYDLSGTRRTLEKSDPRFAVAKTKINPRTGKAYDEKAQKEIVKEIDPDGTLYIDIGEEMGNKVVGKTPGGAPILRKDLPGFEKILKAEYERRIKEKALQKSVANLSPEDFAKLDESVMGQDILDAASKEQIQRALIRGKKALKEKIADTLLSDVDNIDKNIDKVALIPETDIGDAINRHPKAGELKNKLGFQPLPSTAPSITRPLTSEEENEIKNSMGYQLAEPARQVDMLAPKPMPREEQEFDAQTSEYKAIKKRIDELRAAKKDREAKALQEMLDRIAKLP